MTTGQKGDTPVLGADRRFLGDEPIWKAAEVTCPVAILLREKDDD